MSVAPVVEAARSASRPGSPYVGLVPYDEGDAAFFFGRSTEAAIVAMNLRTARLTILYGPSGVGKSSLLMAGAVHRLHGDARAAAAASRFAVCVFRAWRDDPAHGVREAAAAALRELDGAEPPASPAETLAGTLRAWIPPTRTLLVVLDQFEEYFQYHPDESDGEHLTGFAAELARIVNDPTLPVNVLLSIREDAWAKLDRFKGHVPTLFANYVRVDHLDLDAAREAIEGPIEAWNRTLAEGEQPFEIEPALVQAVLAATAGGGLTLTAGGETPAVEAAGDHVEAPFLQLVLDRLWRETVAAGEHTLTLARLEALGGAARIVESHLLDALGRLTPDEQDTASDCFRFLVSRSKTKIAHPASDLAEWTGRPEPEVSAVLDKLCTGESGRILRAVAPAHDEGSTSYELFHDILAEPILAWRRQHELRREQEAEAQRQRAVRRKLGLIGVVLLCLVLAFAGLALWALAERSTAQQRADEAESQALAARSLRAQSLAPRLSLALATRAEERSPTPQAEEALRRSLVAWPKPTVLVAPGRKTYGVDFSPDGRLVATAGGDGAFVRSTTGRLVATLITGKLVYSARFSSDGRFLVTAGADGAIRLWRVRGWRELPSRARASFPRLLARAAFSADDRFLVVGGHPGWPNRVWRFRDGRVGPRLTAPADPRGWIEPDGTARVVDARTAAWAAGVTESAPFAFASSAGARRLAVADYDATRVFRVETRRLLRTLPTAVGAVFGPGGGRLATEGRPTVIWDVSRQRPEAVLAGRFGGAAFSRDGTLLVGASPTRAVARVWDARTGAVLAELPPRPPRFYAAVVLPDPYPHPRYGSAPPSLAGSGAVSVGPGPAFELRPAAGFSPGGDLVATWGRTKGGAQLWRPFGTRRLAVVSTSSRAYTRGYGVSPPPLPVAVSADGVLVAAAGARNEVEVWNVREARRVSTLRGSTERVSSLAFDDEGDLLAAASWDGAVRLWRVADGEPPTDVPRTHRPRRRCRAQPRRRAGGERRRGRHGASLARRYRRARQDPRDRRRDRQLGLVQPGRRLPRHGRRRRRRPHLVDERLGRDGRARPDALGRSRPPGLLQPGRAPRHDARPGRQGARLAQQRRPTDPRARERRKHRLQPRRSAPRDRRRRRHRTHPSHRRRRRDAPRPGTHGHCVHRPLRRGRRSDRHRRARRDRPRLAGGDRRAGRSGQAERLAGRRRDARRGRKARDRQRGCRPPPRVRALPPTCRAHGRSGQPARIPGREVALEPRRP